MHFSVVFSAIVAFIVIVMSLYMTENFTALGLVNPLSPYLQALFAMSFLLIVLLILLAQVIVISLFQPQNRNFRATSFFALFWIFAAIMAVSDLVFIVNFNNVSLVIEDGKLRGSNGLAILISSSITLVFLVLSWIAPLGSLVARIH